MVHKTASAIRKRRSRLLMPARFAPTVASLRSIPPTVSRFAQRDHPDRHCSPEYARIPYNPMLAIPAPAVRKTPSRPSPPPVSSCLTSAFDSSLQLVLRIVKLNFALKLDLHGRAREVPQVSPA